MGNEEQYSYDIKMIQDLNRDLQLSFEQAEAIHKFQKLEYFEGMNDYPTDWEAADLEKLFYKKILLPKQFEVYEGNAEVRKINHIKWLRDTEADNAIQYKMLLETIDYYKATLIPSLAAHLIEIKSLMQKYQEQLLPKYVLFVKNIRNRALIQHVRNTRTFQPDSLETILLRAESYFVWPVYDWFRNTMDEETAKIDKQLDTALESFKDKHHDVLRFHLEALSAFQSRLNQKYYPGPPQGLLIFSSPEVPYQIQLNNFLKSMVIHSPDLYGQ